MLCRPGIDDHGALSLDRRLCPCARKLKQGPFLSFGFGVARPKQSLVGVSPELIGS
jgi:hypothetical protein